MIERFTDRARRVLTLAEAEARALNHNYLGPEHLLLGIVREGEGIAVDALAASGIALAEVRQALVEVVGRGNEVNGASIDFNPQIAKVLELALRESLQLGDGHVGTEHLLLGLVREGECIAARVLMKLGFQLDRLREQVERAQVSGTTVEVENWKAPSEFGRDLTADARNARLSPVNGRNREVEQVMRILTRRVRNCPVLVGDPGIDNVAVVNGLAQMIANLGVPELFGGATVLAVDMATVSDNANFVTLVQMWKNVVLFIDKIDTWADNALLNELLAVEDLRIIGATTSDKYRELSRDPVLERRFQPLEVFEPTVPHAIELLKEERDQYEAHHRAFVTDDALVAAATLAQLFVSDVPLPDGAFELLDEAGATVRLRGVSMPQTLHEINTRIEAIRRDKDAKIDEQDFAAATELRKAEQGLLAERKELENKWRSGVDKLVPQVSEDLIVEIVAARVGLPEMRVRATLPSAPTPTPVTETAPGYALLTDQPVESGDDDLLGTTVVAQRIAAILARADSPFVLAVDGSWGVGKSTLLRQIEDALPSTPDMVKVRFNAWTAHGGNALEALIKSVIGELDSNLLRRWLRRLAKRQRIVGLARIGIAVIARFCGLTRLVDELWQRLQVNAKSRNEFRALVQSMLAEWVQQPGKPRRTLMVFIDDLDRCTDDVVVKVCEAVKLYLDAPGLMFIIGCDLSVLSRGVAAKARGGEGDGRTYLEKIVQVVHRVPAPDQNGVARLIRGYAAQAGISMLVDDTIIDILSERAGRNPRRIKRIVNSFVLEHSLNPAWRHPPLSSAQLIAVIILQHLYPQFFERLAGAGEDPITEFLDYATVRARASDPPSTDIWWATASRVFRRYGAAPPKREAGLDLTNEVERFERTLPPWFPELALNEALLTLLREIGGTDTRRALRTQLVNRPLDTSAFPEPETANRNNRSSVVET